MAVLAVLAAGPGVAGGTPPALDPLDLALGRGEAVFEAMRVYTGRPFRLQAHLERLAASAAAIDLTLPEGLQALAARAVAPPEAATPCSA
jgi:branched-chain amino acid aminotransferase